jgi:hypothetical protein
MSNLLNNVIIWAYGAYKRVFGIRNYSVSRVFLEYYIDPERKYEICDAFWAGEEQYWEDQEEFYIDVSRCAFRETEIPQNVTKTIFRVHYWYDGVRYKHCSYDPEFQWPPPPTSGVQFTLPIIRAVLVDEDDKPKRDVTQKIKRYAGPRGDFHGESVRLADLLYYDEDTLKKEYPKLQITNAIGLKTTVSTVDGYTVDLVAK